MKTSLLIVAILFIAVAAYGQSPNKDSFNSSIANFDINNSLVLIGEAHEVKGTYKTELFLLKEFFKRGKSNIIIEGGISEAYIFNEYLETNNEELLSLTRAGGVNYRRFIDGLKSLNDEYSIEFKGVDFERGVCLEYVFNKWFKDCTEPQLQLIRNSVLSITHKTSAKKIKSTLFEIKQNFEKYQQLLERELEADYVIFKSIVFNPVYQADFGVSSKKRDRYIVENILSIEDNILRKSVLIFGSNHFTNENLFGSILEENLQGKVPTVLFLFAYKNCTNYIRKKNYTSAMPLLEYVEKETTKDPQIDFSLQSAQFLSSLEPNKQFIVTKVLNQ